jgi:hypothetical protein
MTSRWAYSDWQLISNHTIGAVSAKTGKTLPMANGCPISRIVTLSDSLFVCLCDFWRNGNRVADLETPKEFFPGAVDWKTSDPISKEIQGQWE